MYYLSFTVNLLAWVGLGLFIGHRTYLALRRNESTIYLASSLGGLLGGILSSMIHGMYPRVGIDLFNLVWAGIFSFGALSIVVSEARNYVLARIFRASSAFWRKNTTLIPR